MFRNTLRATGIAETLYIVPVPSIRQANEIRISIYIKLVYSEYKILNHGEFI